ncbi:hypothetical protein [Faecalispora sporosphaeroides]|uniref:hypothetical protein n=1 Tax=Faecalispora sporosphaeroides TaxID=1549 RepID=UPI0012B61917|nr:hypothetical protein [Faecalispora sporosphaeroides]
MADGKERLLQKPLNWKRKQAALLVGGLPAFVELFYGNDKKEVYAKSLGQGQAFWRCSLIWASI